MVAMASPSIVPQPASLVMGIGATSISDGNVIRYSDPSLAGVATLLRDDLKLVHSLNLTVEPGASAPAGGVFLSLDPSFPDTEGHRLTANGSITIEAKGVGGIHAGSATLLQAITGAAGNKFIPNMTIEDQPFREFRALMVDVKNHWYTVDQLKELIRLCRFYKVKYISLHTGEAQWIGALMDQTSAFSTQVRVTNRLYTKAEMEDIIVFAKNQGVSIFPHNESCRGFSGMHEAVSRDFDPGDSYANFIDEFDGQGAYTGDYNDTRYWAFIEEMTRRGIDQFKAGYDSGQLPFYHIGPVQGEGGMNRADAARIVGFVQAKDPNVKTMFWNGIDGAQNDALSALKSKIVIAYYTQWGGSDIHGYLNNGWDVVNAAWSPLYIVGTGVARTQRQVHDDWNTFRTGTDGFTENGFDYNAITWNKFDNPATNAQVLGGMLCTWEGPQNIQLDRLRPRLPAFVEHAWNHRDWPYASGDYDTFKIRYDSTDQGLTRFLVSDLPTTPTTLTASDGVFAASIHVNWMSSANTPTGYKVYRHTSNNPGSATLVATVSEASYIDTTASTGTTYYYWVSAFNGLGETPLSNSDSGSRGTSNPPAKAYESFDYEAGTDLHGKNGGTGWASAWSQTSVNGICRINSSGLTYGDLPVSGRSLRIDTATDTPNLQISRTTTGKLGLYGASTWTSFLMKAETAAIGDMTIRFSGINIGKNWGLQAGIGSNSSPVSIVNGVTNFIVCHTVSMNGYDEIYLWVNPPLDIRPTPATADLRLTNMDMTQGSSVMIDSQGYGGGVYDLDELRMGSDWLDVNGGIERPNTAPTPGTMTWITPPLLHSSTSAAMACTPATDEDGVEYYFEETTGHPGGDSSGWQSSPYYTDSGLQPGYVYSYRVKARDLSADQLETGWSFAASVSLESPGTAIASGPQDGSNGAALDSQLSWSAGGGTTLSYDVYFGTSPTLTEIHFRGNQTATTFDPGPLASGTTYYWRIDSVNAYGTTTGTVWSFTTGGGPRELPVAGFSMQGAVATIHFLGDPGVTTWQVKGSENLTSFNIDETANAVITETQPGHYTAVVTLEEPRPPRYFLRVEKPSL